MSPEEPQILDSTAPDAKPGFKLGFRPELDGLRGLAILIVIVGHFFDDIIPAQLGVDLFFSLSGFLITSLLLEEWRRSGRINFKRFYLRRCLRLLPALLLFCLLCGLLSLAGVEGFSGWSRDVWWVLGYLTNYAVVWGFMSIYSPLSVCWSLAVEEHFYILWPGLLVLLLARVGGKAREQVSGLTRVQISRVGAILVVALLLAEGWRWYVLLHSTSTIRLYFATDTHGATLLIGCWMACRANLRLQGGKSSSGAASLHDGIFFGLLAFALLYPLSMGIYILLMPLYGILVSVLVWGGVQWSQGWTGRFLRLSPLRSLGKISYGTYLFHEPILVLVRSRQPELWLSWVAMLGSILLAGLSYRFVESHFLKLKDRRFKSI